MRNIFTYFKQLDAMDCGPTCLRMVAKHYGRNYSLQFLRERSFITNAGVSMQGISDAAESIGFRTMGVKVSYQQLAEEVPLPCIVHWKQKHFVVVYKINKKAVFVADPAHGLIKYSVEEFTKLWLSTQNQGEEKGVALLLETAPDFYNLDDEDLVKPKSVSFSNT